MQALTKKFVTTRYGVVEVHPIIHHRVRKYKVTTMSGEPLGMIERLDSGRWIAHPNRTDDVSSAATAVAKLQRAAQ